VNSYALLLARHSASKPGADGEFFCENDSRCGTERQPPDDRLLEYARAGAEEQQLLVAECSLAAALRAAVKLCESTIEAAEAVIETRPASDRAANLGHMEQLFLNLLSKRLRMAADVGAPRPNLLNALHIYFGGHLFAPFGGSNGIAPEGIAFEDKVENDGIFHKRLEGEFAALQLTVPDGELVVRADAYGSGNFSSIDSEVHIGLVGPGVTVGSGDIELAMPFAGQIYGSQGCDSQQQKADQRFHESSGRVVMITCSTRTGAGFVPLT
jgi:hypothetical protein